MTAFDKDEQHTDNSRVAYYLTKQTPLSDEPRFTIDPTSGLIHISGCLNYAVKYILHSFIYCVGAYLPRASLVCGAMGLSEV